jgi:hypothetical protein
VVDVDPGVLRFQLEPDLGELVEAIHDDTNAGPITLSRRGAEVVLRLTEKTYYERPLQIWMEVQGLARALLEARPDCMPLANLASETVRPLPELYGRGKDEGARMRADLRERIVIWLAAVDSYAADIELQRLQLSGSIVSAQAIGAHDVFTQALPHDRPWYLIGGPEKFVPPNYEFNPSGLQRVPLEDWDGILTGAGVKSPSEVQRAIASLRFETVLL